MQASKLWMPRPEPRVEQAAAQSGTAQPRSKLEAALALLHDDGDVTKTLDAARCKLTPAEIRALAEAILNKKGSLNAIDLRDCGLEPEGCRTLCEAMGEVYTLEELRMCSNLLHGDGEPGLKWKDVGRQKPKVGTEIDNENLAHFLRPFATYLLFQASMAIKASSSLRLRGHSLELRGHPALMQGWGSIC